MALHHVSVGTNDLDRAQGFYDPIMEVIGLRRIKRSDRVLGYGLTEIIFSVEKPVDGGGCIPGNGIHVAFHAGHRNAVDEFHSKGHRLRRIGRWAAGDPRRIRQALLCCFPARPGWQQDRGRDVQRKLKRGQVLLSYPNEASREMSAVLISHCSVWLLNSMRDPRDCRTTPFIMPAYLGDAGEGFFDDSEFVGTGVSAFSSETVQAKAPKTMTANTAIINPTRMLEFDLALLR